MSVVVSPATVAPADRAEPAAAGRTWLPRAVVLLVAVELALVYAPTLVWLFDRWTMGVWNNAHGLLIPPAVAWFAWQELRPLRDAPRESSAWGYLFLLPALALHVLDTGMHTQILSAASIVLALPGLSLLFLGRRRSAAIAFPLAFLLFMLPIPLAVTERLHLVLRQIATVATAWIVPMLGVTVYSEGTSLHLVDGVLFVGDACSGFSTLYAAVAVAVLTAFSCNDWRRRVVALAAAVPLAVAANVVRIILLVFVVRWLGTPALETWMHPASGVLTFALSLPVILWLGRPVPRRQAA
jgi:exosortase